MNKVLAFLAALIMCSCGNNSVEQVTVDDDVGTQLAFQDSLLNYLYELRVEHVYIVYSQAVIETGNFTSKIFKENNNLFGLKLAGSRPTTSRKAQYGHAYYNNWKESVLDYCFYQAAFARGLSEEAYFDKLRRSYAEDDSYVDKVKEIKKSINESRKLKKD